jgi:DNA-binding CsgD family transcriptional regulator
MAKVMARRRTNTQEHMDMLHTLRLRTTHSYETKARISAAKKGVPSAFKGREHTPEAKAANAAAHVGKMTGAKHAQWDDSIDTERDILARLRTGMTATDVAKAIGKTRTFVQRRLAGIDLASHGIVLKRGARKGADQSHVKRRKGAEHHAYRADIDDEVIKVLHAEGLSPQAIANRLGCSETMVRGRLGL